MKLLVAVVFGKNLNDELNLFAIFPARLLPASYVAGTRLEHQTEMFQLGSKCRGIGEEPFSGKASPYGHAAGSRGKPVEIVLPNNDIVWLLLRGIDHYDPRFGAAFYDGTRAFEVQPRRLSHGPCLLPLVPNAGTRRP